MEKSILAGIIIVIIAIVIVAVVAFTYRPGSYVSTSTTTVPGSNTTGLTNTGGGILAAGCTPSSVFGCSNATITLRGEISFSLTSMESFAMNNVHVACIAYNSSTNRPVNSSSWYALSNLGTPKQANFTGTAIQPGGVENIASLQCYTANGMPVSLAAGQTYKGLLLLNYTSGSGQEGPGNSWVTVGAAAVNLNAAQNGAGG